MTTHQTLQDLARAAHHDLRTSWRQAGKRWLLVAALVLAVFVPRLLSLGTTLTVDEPLWRDRGVGFIKDVASLHFAETIPAGQPGVTTAWLVGLTYPVKSLAADQAVIALAGSLLILIITYFLVQLWGWRWGMIAGFFLALDPFLIAHSRLVHTDALLALFALLSAVALLAAVWPRYAGRPLIKRYLVVSAVAGGLALLTKVSFLLAMPALAALLFATLWQTRTSWRQILAASLVWGAVFALTVFVLWPALWQNAGGVVSLLTERSALHAGGTRAEETTSADWYYLREGFFRLTPVTSLLALAGIAGLASAHHAAMRRAAVALGISGVAFAILLSFGGDKSDRYILFTLLTVVLFAVYGLRLLTERLARRWAGAALLPLVCLLWLAADAARLHPYYLAHYNRLYPIEADHKLGWGEGLEQAAAWIRDRNPDASVAAYYPRVLGHWLPGGSTENVDKKDNKDYLVLYRSMFERGEGAPETDIVNEYLGADRPPEHVISINGLPYVWIFRP